jgi:hypothetical protein
MSNEAPSPKPSKRGPHFLTDKKGKRLAVVLPLDHYKRLVLVNKRIARLERLAGTYHDIGSALDELRSILAGAETAPPVEDLLNLPADNR